MSRLRTSIALSLTLHLAAPAAGIPPVEPAASASLQAATGETPDVGREEALRLISAWLKGMIAFRKVPGMSAGIVKGQQTIWSKGFGHSDAQGRVAASPDTRYSICSISKLFTAVAVMQQVEQDRLALDKPLTDYLPWAKFAEVDRASGPVTLRGLLTHAAGVPREGGFQYWGALDFTFPTREVFRQSFADQTRLYGGFTRYQYSNMGLTLAGEAVIAASGQPYADYVTTNILRPLKLDHTTPYLPMKEYGRGLAVGHGYLDRDGKRMVLKPFDAGAVTPAAGFASSVVDLARFAQWQFRLLQTGKTEVLQSSTLRDMQRVQFMDPDWRITRGLGFGVYRRGDKTYVGHSGECPGYFTRLMLHLASETAVIVMMNAAEPSAPYVDGIFDILNKRQFAKYQNDAASPLDLEPYAGRYSTQPWGAEVMVLPWAGGLVTLGLPSMSPGDDMTILKPVGEDRFRRIRPDGSEAEIVRFERGKDGRISQMIWHDTPSPRLGAAD